MLAPIANRAAELGPAAFPWWKDWRGQAVAIIASGPSAKKVGVDKLKGRLPVLAIKENVDLCPWADVVYGCDRAWWKHRKGLKDFGGVKIAHDPRVRGDFPDVNLITIPKVKERGQDRYCNDLLIDVPGTIGGGCNSGFQAINLAVQFGAIRILLTGFDMHVRGEVHWYGKNTWQGGHNAGDSDMKRWRGYLDVAAEKMRRLGIDVVNASPHSALACFRKMSIDDALSAWGL